MTIAVNSYEPYGTKHPTSPCKATQLVMHQIIVASDGTGRTAEQALHAALTQFAQAEVEITRRAEVRTKERVRAIVQEAVKTDALIVHTLVSDQIRAYMIREGRLHNVETIDLMGSLLARLSEHLANSPSEEPGLFRTLNDAYFRRIEAMEFAFRHDDGQRVRELDKAEIVLVGVSRTFKTPLSIYLAFKGWFVANVPLILNFRPPPILSTLPPERVFGLTTNPHQLALLRRSRHEHLGGVTGDYARPEFVRSEIMYALNIFSQHPGWSIIDVTNKPIEEIASEILALGRAVKRET